MQMLYNSDHYVVVRFDVAPEEATRTQASRPGWGGYEIVDKLARKEIFLVGAMAERFQQGAKELAQNNPSPEQFDEFIAGFTALAQHPVTLH